VIAERVGPAVKSWIAIRVPPASTSLLASA